MSTIVFDPLYIKGVERELGRKLDEDEIEAIKYGEVVDFQRYDKTWVSFRVPYCELESLSSCGWRECNFFDFAFDGGSMKRAGKRG